MKEIDEMMALVKIKELKELRSERDAKDDLLEFYNEVLKNLELFLTFWYKESSQFGKIKDNFNEQDEFPCELRLKDGRVKIKMNKENNEEDNSSD